jgi:hypothetical protein
VRRSNFIERNKDEIAKPLGEAGASPASQIA